MGQGGGQGGGDGGGAPESSVGATRRDWFHLLGSLKNLTIGLIWLVTRRVGREAGKGGEMGAAERWEVKWRGLTRCGGL